MSMYKEDIVKRNRGDRIMQLIIEEGKEHQIFHSPIRDEDTIVYKNTEIPASHLHKLMPDVCTSMNGVSAERILTLAKKTYDAGIILTPISAKKLAKMEHKGRADEFIENYKIAGLTKCPETGKKETEEILKVIFGEQKRFHGRTPQILPQIAAACDYYKRPKAVAAEKFSIQYVRELLSLGLSTTEVFLLYTSLSEQQLSDISHDLYKAQMISTLLDKAYLKKSTEHYSAAMWIADHVDTDLKLLEKVYNKADELDLHKSTSVDALKTQFNNLKATSEVKKIEKAYKKCGFKLENCVCDLHKTVSTTDRYKAEILEGTDPRQVMLGYETDCCQHLGEAGESAMMHGLLHPKAGFWVVTKKDSGKVVAQAESWELNKDTLVFDNIEFANDAEIDQYKEIIYKWVSECKYSNVIMGCAYNALSSNHFKSAGAVVPPVTAYELYVLSYEEDCDAREEICHLKSEEEARMLMETGKITYFDYVYCDSERNSVYLKENNKMADFFEEYEKDQEESEYEYE